MLNREEIEKLIKEKNLVEGCVDLEKQITPNGIDLTAASIYHWEGAGSVDFSNKERVLPEEKEILPKKLNPGDKFGWWDLARGVYKIKTNETVNMPQDLIAMATSRTTLLRMGAFTEHGIWDAGFRGKSEFMLVVENPAGIKIKQNARVAQLVFVPIQETSHSYNGIYQNKK